MRSFPDPLVLSTAIVLAGSPAAAQDHDHPAGDAAQLGRVTFPVTCAAAVMPDFERAVAMLHSCR